jgi:hypothetical protein
MQERIAQEAESASKGLGVGSSEAPIVTCTISKVPYSDMLEKGRDDFPVSVLRVDPGPVLHVVDLDGETWIKQLLYTFGQLGVSLDRLEDRDVNCGLADRVKAAIADLFKSSTDKGCEGLASLTIGTKGLIPATIDRLARQSVSYQDAVAQKRLDGVANELRARRAAANNFDAKGFLVGAQKYAQELRHLRVVQGGRHACGHVRDA